LGGIFRGALWAPWLFTRASKRNARAVVEAIKQYKIDEVWLDFPSTLAFAGGAHDVPMDYFVHDVVSQKIARRPLLAFLERMVRRTEQALLCGIRRCIVLSQKDGNLLREGGFRGDIVIQPPTQVRVGEVINAIPVTSVIAGFSGYRNLVFFGNMRRAENHWSMLHFIIFLFPRIRQYNDEVRLWILGLSPRWSLRFVGWMMSGVHIVGAVDNPEPAFRHADLCVVPLRLGAGVKIKVLQMLEAGAKVVASPVGGEGIDKCANLMVVPYDQIPDTVCQLLSTMPSRC
jgi:glycosyltransferase involved in cell wall biosynthesis